MYGILLLSLAYIQEKSYFKSAFAFAILLNFKHIYLYCAPCFGLFFLRKLVFKSTLSMTQKISNFCRLAVQTILVFAISFGPFIYTGQFKAIVGRLFPFARGLVHYYWAPNFWALYMAFHKYLLNIVKQLSSITKVKMDFEADDIYFK